MTPLTGAGWTRRDKALLAACFFLSGATSLSLEVVWAKELSYVLGNTLYAVSTVVAGFMSGLALGSALAGRYADRLARPLRTYAWLQVGVGLSGMLLLPLLRQMRPAFEALHGSLAGGGGRFLLARFAVVFALMLVPTVLMGMTLPVVVGALGREKEQYEQEAGLAYGTNTLGAVMGTLLAGYLLIPWLGLLRTGLLAGGLDLLVGVLALALDRRVGVIRDVHRAPAVSAASGWTPRQWAIAAAFAASGAVALVLEVGWFRLLGLALGPSVHAFSAMLATYLSGVGLGSALGARWVAASARRGIRLMAALEVALGVAGLVSLHYLNLLPMASFWTQWTTGRLGAPGLALGHLLISSLVVLVPCFVMGLLFPIAVRALLEAGRNTTPERTVGRLYVFNTAGGILGSLTAGFALLPRFGVWPTLVAAGVTSVLLGVLLALLDRELVRPRPVLRAGFALVAALAIAGTAPAWNVTLYNQGLYRDGYRQQAFPLHRIREERLVYYREGINAPVAVMKYFGGATLFISGKPDASTYMEDLDTQLFLGHLPVMLAREPRRVAVIGYGSGLTAHAVLTHPEVRSLDVLEIERGVVDASPYFECLNRDPFGDPRTRLVLEDGRIHLTYARETYDVITSEPSNPWMAGVSNLFTADFYRTVRSRLAPGGIFAQWIQDYDITEDTYRVLLASLRDSFPFLTVFRPNRADSIVLASARPIALPWETFRARFASPAVQASFHRAGQRDPLRTLFLLQCPAEGVESFVGNERGRSTDDNVWLEHRMPFEMLGRGDASGTAGHALVRWGAPLRLRALEAMLPGFPLEDGVREMIRHPHAAEPVPLPGAVASDPWRDFRAPLLDGLRRELLERGRADLAERAAAWDREGEAYQAQRTRATSLLQPMVLGDRPRARAAIEEAAALAPDPPLGLVLRGQAAEDEGDAAAAERHYRRALDHPGSRFYYDALLGLARLAKARGEAADALRLCREAAARNPYQPDAFVLAARLHLEKADGAAARAQLEDGLRFNPGDPALLSELAALAPAT
jgi:spermidine synthase